MKRMQFTSSPRIALAIAACLMPASAIADAIGGWQTADGGLTVAITRCANAICGRITRVAPGASAGKTAVGYMLIKDMTPTQANNWSGTVFDPRDGASYQGSLKLLSKDRLKITGCAVGGLVCQSETWTRVQP
jgi:uncharacterized protein (DUF2147 family)